MLVTPASRQEEWDEIKTEAGEKHLCYACLLLGDRAPDGACRNDRHTGDHLPNQGREEPPRVVQEPRWTDADLDTLKELSRKLGWAVTSTLGLRGEAKAKIYGWAEGYARSLLARYNRGA